LPEPESTEPPHKPELEPVLQLEPPPEQEPSLLQEQEPLPKLEPEPVLQLEPPPEPKLELKR